MQEGNPKESVFSKSVRAGKRTYFFDIKSTRGNDLFLTITESKRRLSETGESSYEKHKIYLYKEDFEKFMDGLHETFNMLDDLKNSEPGNTDLYDRSNADDNTKAGGEINFEDL